MYAKIENNELIYYKPLTILGFITTPSKELLLKQGYKRVVDCKPTYDEETQIVRQIGFSENEENILINYKVVDINPELTLEEKVKELKQENIDLLIDNFDINFRLFELECALQDWQSIHNKKQ